MRVGDLPPTQLYASLAFVLSVVTLWLNRLKDDDDARQFVRSLKGLKRQVVYHAPSLLLTLPVARLLHAILFSSIGIGHKLAHAVPLIGGMLSIIPWWIRAVAATRCVED